MKQIINIELIIPEQIKTEKRIEEFWICKMTKIVDMYFNKVEDKTKAEIEIFNRLNINDNL